MKLKYLLTSLLCKVGLFAFAQSPVVKVDLNMSGRSELECNDPNYTPWIPDNALTTTKTINGVTFIFKKTGSNGVALKADWYKAGIQAANYARLASDGMIVETGDAGAEIELTITGLATGTHTLMAFHNTLPSPTAGTFAPLDVYVNGTLVINNLTTSNRALTTSDLASSYITFSATAVKSTVILYKAETGTTATLKNVYINGFELNTPNVKEQSKSPIPNDGDMHVDGDNGSATLSWTAAASAVSHRVYIGTDSTCVASGTTSSSCYKGQQTGTTFNMTGLYSMNTYYWRVDEVNASGVVTKGNTWVFRPRQLAFPGAEGYGRFAIGGRGGRVVHVTNLNDSGVGSLRYAVETETGPRTIVFDVSGVIVLNSRLVLSDSYVTVAGQTAPNKGICIRTAPFGFTGNDVIGRQLRLRLGGGPTYDGMGMTGSNHSILDHCSISWTIDESFSSRSGKNITLQKTLISEALNVAGHQNYPAGTAHGYAATISGDVGSFHHNLLAHCDGRNWSMGGGLDANGNYAGRLDIFNNVVYNWYDRTTDGGAHEVNFVNNYYKPGAATKIFTALNAQYDNFPGTQQYFMSGNVMPGYFNATNQAAGRTVNGTPNGYSPWVSSAFFPSYATIHSADDAFKVVLSDVGNTQPVLDDHDVRVINETYTGTAKYKGSVSGLAGLPDNESDVGGYESYPTITRASNWDSDKDGLPDFWETATGTSNSSASGNFADANADPDKNGYTELEEYLNWMAETHYFVTTGTQTIDLAAMFKGFANTGATYTATSLVNVTVTISGTTATFKPTICGFASFSLTVKDASGSTMTKSVGVFASGTCTTPIAQKATITKQGAGSSNQTITLGSAIVNFSYVWANANTVTVTGMPAGVLVDINNTTKTVSVSGTPTAIGAFKFSVSTVGGSPDSTRSGSITVNNVLTDVSSNEFNVDYNVYPNPFYGNITIEKPHCNAFIKVYNQLGELVFESNFIDKLVFGEKLSTGIYTIRITEDKQTKSVNVIKK